MNKTRHVVLAALATSLALPATAEEQSPVIVTATRTAQTVDESLATVTVISRKEIESSQAVNLTDILKTQAGINVTTQGGIGKSQSVFIRGTESSHMLVLIDGIRASSATTGEFAWETLLAEQVERIEIVYGPRASLYGSDAIGGVISITTRESKKTSISVNYGSYNTQQTNITTGGGENWKYYLSAGLLTTDGFPTRELDTEDYGHKRGHLTATVKKQLNSDTGIEARINHSQGSNEHETSTGNSEFKKQVISTVLKNTISETWNQKFLIGHTIDQYTTFSPTTPSTITTKRKSASWQHDFFINDHTTTIGVDYWEDHATKNNSGVIDQVIDNSAIYLQQQWNMQNNDIVFNARSDKHSEFGNKVTGSIAWGHTIGKNRLILSYATAFKAPSINDLFWPYSTSVYFGTTYITQGNTNIKPESSKSTEISWKTKPTKNLTWNTSIYQTEIEDLIDWEGTLTAPSEYTYMPTNINSASILGFETTISYKINDWKLDTNITFLDAKNNETGNQLDRRARQSVTTTITRYLGNKYFSIEALSESERNDRDGAIKLDSYMLINLLYSHNVNNSLKWNFRLDNIADTDYTLASSPSGDYRTPGRNAHLGINYIF
ncbi:MAG: TonB-dependent receptor [Gammaproteobacteria bacterium]|nr:TonB-dependent receptor [Gammaproteobacteria bacterium]